MGTEPYSSRHSSRRKNFHKLQTMKTHIVFLLFALFVIINGEAVQNVKAADKAVKQADKMAVEMADVGQDEMMADPQGLDGEDEMMADPEPRRRRLPSFYVG